MPKAAPAPKPNYTQSPNVFYDEWLREITSLSELKVVEAVIRQTFGWHREEVKLSLTGYMKLTGLTEPSVIEGIRQALEDGYIERERDGQGWRYWIAVEPDETPKDSLGLAPKNSLEVIPKESLGEPLKTFKGSIDKERNKENSSKETIKKTTTTSARAQEESPSSDAQGERLRMPDPFPLDDELLSYAAANCPLIDPEKSRDLFLTQNYKPPKGSPQATPLAHIPVPLPEWRRRLMRWFDREQEYAVRDLSKNQQPNGNGHATPARRTGSKREESQAVIERLRLKQPLERN